MTQRSSSVPSITFDVTTTLVHFLLLRKSELKNLIFNEKVFWKFPIRKKKFQISKLKLLINNYYNYYFFFLENFQYIFSTCTQKVEMSKRRSPIPGWVLWILGLSHIGCGVPYLKLVVGSGTSLHLKRKTENDSVFEATNLEGGFVWSNKGVFSCLIVRFLWIQNSWRVVCHCVSRWFSFSRCYYCVFTSLPDRFFLFQSSIILAIVLQWATSQTLRRDQLVFKKHKAFKWKTTVKSWKPLNQFSKKQIFKFTQFNLISL